MKILPIEKIREADVYTIEHEPISSLNLMERAASQLYMWFLPRCKSKEVSIKIFCGMGNNGGDGLALARLLYLKDIVSQVFILRVTDNFSPDCNANYECLKNDTEVPIYDIYEGDSFPALSDEDVIVDAVFGSGLSRPLSGFTADLIKYLNESQAVRIAIDIPSGLYADKPVEKDAAVLKADYTLTFQFPKLAYMFPESDKYVGKWEVLDIQLHPDYIEEVDTLNFYTTADVVKPLIRKRTKYSHKGTYGHALLIAGSSGKSGAALLSAESCLRGGAGLLTVHLPKAAALPLQSYLPEAMVDADKNESHLTHVDDLLPFTAIGIGPGIGKNPDTVNALKAIIQDAKAPLVLDADALNILSENRTWLAFLPKGTILTPHPKEFERLFGVTANSFERLECQRNMSMNYGLVIVLKGANTSITFPNGVCFFNSTGNPGMATAGSGDVLTGIILSLLAQHYSQEEAALLGVYLHGLAGDIAAQDIGYESLIASDISKYLGKAFLWFM